MEPVFNERKLRAWLEPLSRRARTAFALSCCERMLPSIEMLFAGRGRGDPTALREIPDAAWAFVGGRDPSPDLAELNATHKRTAFPDTRSGSIHDGPAANAALACSFLLETIAGGSIDKAIEVAALAADSAESYALHELGLPDNAPDLDTRVAAHPLVQQELRRQREDIRLLHRTSLDRPESVAALRLGWRGRSTADRTP